MKHNRYLEKLLRERVQAQAKQCYKNSVLALQVLKSMPRFPDDQIFYVEGWLGGILPIEHGWLEVKDKLVDVTLPGRYPGASYFPGQRFALNTILGEINRSHTNFNLPVTLTKGRGLKAHRFPPTGFACPEFKRAYEQCTEYCFGTTIPRVLSGGGGR